MWFPFLLILAYANNVTAGIPDEVQASRFAQLRAQRLIAFIENTQKAKKGLPVSFPGSAEKRLHNITFTYDVGVGSIAWIHAGKHVVAEKPLSFYRKMHLPHASTFHFNTAYDTERGLPALEYHMHGGPLFWIALAMMHYYQATDDKAFLIKALSILEWTRTQLAHREGGVMMGVHGQWAAVMSTENNWVYYAAMRMAERLVPEGQQKQALVAERRAVRQWLASQQTQRGWNKQIGQDTVRALDVYTHILLVGPEAHVDYQAGRGVVEVMTWAKAHIAQLEAFFRVPGHVRYDYTDAWECGRIGRPRIAWLEGTAQVSVAYHTWAQWVKAHGDADYAQALFFRAQQAHAEVLSMMLTVDNGLAVPNTDADNPYRTFLGGWLSRPKREPAVNATSWAYFSEVRFNPLLVETP